MANEITFDKLPQAVGYQKEQVERIHKIVATLQSQTKTDKHRIVAAIMQSEYLTIQRIRDSFLNPVFSIYTIFKTLSFLINL